MKPATDFVLARNGSVIIEEHPSWLSFFNKYVPAAQAVRLLLPFSSSSLLLTLLRTGRRPRTRTRHAPYPVQVLLH